MAAISATEALKELAAVEDGDEVTVIQPKVADILGRYLRARGYSAKHKGPGQIDVAVFVGRTLVAAVEVKRPKERIDSNAFRQLLKYMASHACPTGIATNGAQVFLLHAGTRQRVDRYRAELLDKAFPRRNSMKNLTDAQFKRLVVDCLDDVNFFTILREKVFDALEEAPESERKEKTRPAADLLPSDLRELEGEKLVPRSKRVASVVATVRNGRVHVRNRSYTSLSAAAQSVTGSSVNGRKWWRLA